jgi:hypothetical protein
VVAVESSCSAWSVRPASNLECSEPAAETGELVRRQLGNGFGDFFDFHVAQYSTAETWLSDGQELGCSRSHRFSAKPVKSYLYRRDASDMPPFFPWWQERRYE